MIKIICFIFIVLFIPLDSSAHSGGTNAEGCHHNRKMDEYHCHNKKMKIRQYKNPVTPSETGNEAVSSTEKISNPKFKKRIFQWVDEKGEVHYSNNIDDLPVNARESMNSR